MHWLPYRVSKAHRSSVYPSSEHSHNGLTFETSDSELLIMAKLNSADRVKVSYTESLWLTSRASDHGIQRSEVGFLLGAQNFFLCPWKKVSFAQGFTSKTRLNAKPIKENEILSSFRYYSV